MPRVMIRCPATEMVVATNLTMDEGTFDAIRIQGQRFQCKACNQLHTWGTVDAWVEGARPQTA